MTALREVTAVTYLAPLREGGSLPAVIEADDGELYVLKFVGAGHGHRALVAEILTGEIARALGLHVPELALVHLDPVMARSERDEEIQDLIWASAGTNLGVRFLPGALAFQPALAPPPGPEEAATVVWLDAFTINVDRTAQNTNLLLWADAMWLIDHGSSLYFHHNWDRAASFARERFAHVRHHVLLPLAGDLAAADERARRALGPDRFQCVAEMVPDAWLSDEPRFAGPQEHRRAYAEALTERLGQTSGFVEEAESARAMLV